MMKKSTTLLLRLSIAAGSMILYAIIFEFIYPRFGMLAGAFNAIPAVVFGWLFRIPGCLLYGLIAVPTSTLLYRSVGDSAYSSIMPNLVGTGAFMLVSAGIGWVRKLNDRVQEQATQLQKANNLLQQRNIDLQKALFEIKQLRGIIPICSSCKKIRDDEGFWQNVESYVSDHSEAEFSHSICPECIKKLYSEFVDKEE